MAKPRPNEDMRYIAARVSNEMADQVREIAKRDLRTTSGVITLAVAEYLKRHNTSSRRSAA